MNLLPPKDREKLGALRRAHSSSVDQTDLGNLMTGHSTSWSRHSERALCEDSTETE